MKYFPFDTLFVRLGGMHTLIHSIGAICTFMAGSGLSHILFSTFAGVEQLLTDKEYNYCLRALKMVAEIILEQLLQIEIILSYKLYESSRGKGSKEQDLQNLARLFTESCMPSNGLYQGWEGKQLSTARCNSESNTYLLLCSWLSQLCQSSFTLPHDFWMSSSRYLQGAFGRKSRYEAQGGYLEWYIKCYVYWINIYAI